MECGTDIRQIDYTATSSTTSVTETEEASDHPAAQPQPPPNKATYPYSNFAGYSVLQKVGPARPALTIFWLGLVLLVLSLLCSACAVAFGLLGAPPDATPDDLASFRAWSFGVGGCLLVVMLVPGILMLYAGRPRWR